MKNLVIIICVTLASQSFAQNILTPEDAKQITLENNFGIQLQKMMWRLRRI